MSSPASQAAALGKRNSEPRAAKRGAKAARGDLVDATSPPPFSPMSPTAALSRAFSAMPIIDTSSSSSSDPPSSPGRADPTPGPRALSVDSHQVDLKAKVPKARPESKPRTKKPEREKRDETKERKRNGEQAISKSSSMSISAPSGSTNSTATAPSPAPIAATREPEKKKLNLPRVPEAPPPTPQFRCPYCSRDFDEQQLIQHVLSDHHDGNPRVVCPICARAPGGDASLRSRNFQGHLQARHGGVLIQKKAPRKFVAPPTAAETPVLGRGGYGGGGGEDEGGGEWVSLTPHLQHLRDRSLESLWDYVLSFDSTSRQSRCEACRGKLSPTEATCLLHCGHTYHSGCISETDPDPQCPVCLSMTGDAMND